jgi:ABC-type lipoprotein release transport system permease subunit
LTIGIGSAVVAVAVGLALSPLLPVGVAGIAEPHPGFAVDGLVLGIGAVATVLLVTLLSAPPAWRASRAAGNALGTAEIRGSERPSAVAGFLSRTALPPSAAAGVRMALEPGRGRTAVPVRAAMFGATLSLLALSAALVFGASLNHLVGTPGLSGWNWTFVAFSPPATSPKGVETANRLDAFLDRSRQVEGYAVGTIGNVTVKGSGMLSVTIEPRKGDVTPSIVEGSLPQGSDEIMLGTETMRTLGISLGDTVKVSSERSTVNMRVVGRFVMPLFFFATTRPGQGADLSLAGADRLFGGTKDNGHGVFVRLAPGVTQRTVTSELKRRIGPIFVVPRLESSKVHSLSGATGAPIVLAGIVVLMATATLGHTLITSIRRRRLDLAILKTLGFNRRQVSSTVAWQATSLALAAIVVGLPLGVISGRWAWSVFADHLGVVPDPVIPILAVLLAVPATIVLANLLAVVPGRIAARLKAGPVLRSE